eukprot:jgi/Pico_ML_1/55729/g1378.t1
MAAESMTAEEISGLDVLFSQLDADKSGSITFQELKDGFRHWNVKMEDSELRQIMNSVDVDGDGKLDYREFITATLHRHQLAKEEHILDVFLRLDFNGDGRLTMDEVQLALEGEYGADVKDDITEVFGELDLDGDGRIDYEEFLAMMRKGYADLKKTNSLPTRGSKEDGRGGGERHHQGGADQNAWRCFHLARPFGGGQEPSHVVSSLCTHVSDRKRTVFARGAHVDGLRSCAIAIGHVAIVSPIVE